jgi:hypothetical protein
VQFIDMWEATDVRPILPTICVPTAIPVYEGRDRGDTEQAYYMASHIPGARLVTVPRPWMPASADEEAELDRMLATVLFTDIVGSTYKASELGNAGWRATL